MCSWQWAQFHRSGSFGVLLGNSQRANAANGRLLQRHGKAAAGRNLQLVGPPRHHVQKHAQIDGFSHPARAQRGEHDRVDFLRLGLMRQDHRRKAMPAHVGIQHVALLANQAGDVARVLCQAIRIQFQGNASSHQTVSAISGDSCAAVRLGEPSGAFVRSHMPIAERNPILCLRAKA